MNDDGPCDRDESMGLDSLAYPDSRSYRLNSQPGQSRS
jgi:hypothetical protein